LWPNKLISLNTLIMLREFQLVGLLFLLGLSLNAKETLNEGDEDSLDSVIRIYEESDTGYRSQDVIKEENDQEENKSLEIYPNPCENEVNITGAKLKYVTLFGKAGERIKQFLPSENKIDMSSIPSGSYIVEIVTMNNKVIIERLAKK